MSINFSESRKALDHRIEKLVNDFSVDFDDTNFKGLITNALNYCLVGMGVHNRSLSSSQSSENLRNYLDANDIPFREVDTPEDLYTKEHPPIIVLSKDCSDVYCHLFADNQDLIYSAYHDCLIKTVAFVELDTKAFEIFALLPDEKIPILELGAFVIYGELWPILRVIAASIVTVILYLILPLFTAPLITEIIPSREIGILTQFSFGFFLILCISSVSTYLQNILLIRIETVSDIRTQTALWDRLIRLPLPFLSKFSAGDLNSRVDAVTKIRQLLSSSIIQTVLNAIFSLIYLLIMFLFSPVLTLILCFGLIFLLIIVSILIYFDFKLQLPIFEQEAELTNFSLQMLNTVVPLRSNNCENQSLFRWLKSVQSVARLYMQSKIFNNFSHTISVAYGYLSIAAIIFYVAIYSSRMPTLYLQDNLGLLAGRFLTVLVAYKALVSSLTALITTVGTTFSQVYVQWKRSKPIFEQTVDFGYSVLAKRHILRNSIILDDISYTYPGASLPIFKGVNMEFPIGKYTAITGPSGCGKSTLLRILLGLDQPSSGSVMIDGIPMNELNIRVLRRVIGVVPQSITLFSGSLRKNLCSGLYYSDDEIWHSLELAEMSDRVFSMPMKLDTVVMGGGRSLSGGERQRLTIARALISRPKLLIFDEATSALDPIQQQTIINNVINASTSLIAVAHRLSTIKAADNVYELDKYTSPHS